MLKWMRRRNECVCGEKKPDCKAEPLCAVKSGGKLRVAGIEGGRHLCARMASMGIYPGVEMEVLCEGCGCPCLVRVHGGTLSLGHGVSEKILVTPTG